MIGDDPKEIVKKGYDILSRAYREDNLKSTSKIYIRYQNWVSEISKITSPGSKILDLGCGCGIPVSSLLSKNYQVAGVDISPVQIERAKKLVPSGKFICADMCELEFPENSFHAIMCLYSIIHVPLSEQPSLISKMFQWIIPGGYLLIIVGQREWTGFQENWLGVKGGDMYWSHASRQTYDKWLFDAGFSMIWQRFIPEGKSGHHIFLMQKCK